MHTGRASYHGHAASSDRAVNKAFSNSAFLGGRVAGLRSRRKVASSLRGVQDSSGSRCCASGWPPRTPASAPKQEVQRLEGQISSPKSPVPCAELSPPLHTQEEEKEKERRERGEEIKVKMRKGGDNSRMEKEN